jgi:hypothetical protein
MFPDDPTLTPVHLQLEDLRSRRHVLARDGPNDRRLDSLYALFKLK